MQDVVAVADGWRKHKYPQEADEFGAGQRDELGPLLDGLVDVCRSKIRFSPVSCGDAARSGSVTVFVYQAVEDGLSPDAMGLQVGDSGRGGWFGAVWG